MTGDNIPPGRSSWRRPLIVAALLVFTRVLCSGGIGRPAAGPSKASLKGWRLPVVAAGSPGRPVPVSAAVCKLLRADAASEMLYRLPGSDGGVKNGNEVDVFIAYSGDARDFHNPALCLGVLGWTTAASQERTISYGGKSMTVTVLNSEQGNQQRGDLYFYLDANREMTGWFSTVLRATFRRVLKQPAESAQVHLTFGPGAVDGRGQFTPQFKALAFSVSSLVQRCLKQRDSLPR